MSDEARLLDKLAAIEALFAGASTSGERGAAANARQRILERLAEFEERDPPVEMQFTLDDVYTQRLFIALAKRYDLRPFRYRRQKRQTIMLKVPKRFLDETLWPEFEALSHELRSHLDELTARIIQKAVYQGDLDEVEEGQPPELPG
jgi:hypothetical protein